MYLAELRQQWQEEAIVVRISQIETRLLSISGILDLRDTTINGETKNLVIDVDAVPVLGSVKNG